MGLTRATPDSNDPEDMEFCVEQQKLFRTFIGLICFISFGFVLVGTVFYAARRAELEKHVNQLVVGVVESNNSNLAMELFVNQTAAYKLRLTTIQDRLGRVVSNPSLCLFSIEGELIFSTLSEQNCDNERGDNTFLYEITENNQKLANLWIGYESPFSMAIFLKNYGTHVTLIFVAFLSSILLLILFFNRYMRQTFSRVIIFERQASMGLTAQMIAHDILKPLNIQQHGLALISNSDDPMVIKKIISTTLPAVERTKLEIENMLADLREAGSQKALETQPVGPKRLIETTVSDLSKLFDWLAIDISYQFKHSKRVHVDKTRITRIFSNIVCNAVEAMECEGRLWFHTRDVENTETPFVEFCIGNSDSLIPEDKIKDIFSAFYTTGRSGNGLGMAIAKKIVNAHGGQIWCRSSKENGTEFCFTLPGVIEDYKSNGKAEYNLPQRLSGSSANTVIVETPDVIQSSNKNSNHPIKILVVDDDTYFQNAINDLVESNKMTNVSILNARNSKSALEICRTQNPELVILDLDLGPQSDDGHEILRQIREDGQDTKICICTSSADRATEKKSYSLGASHFTQKPMTATLLKELLEGNSE